MHSLHRDDQFDSLDNGIGLRHRHKRMSHPLGILTDSNARSSLVRLKATKRRRRTIIDAVHYLSRRERPMFRPHRRTERPFSLFRIDRCSNMDSSVNRISDRFLQKERVEMNSEREREERLTEFTTRAIKLVRTGTTRLITVSFIEIALSTIETGLVARLRGE